MWILWTALYVTVALWCMRFMYQTWGQRHLETDSPLRDEEALWGSILTGVFWPVMLPVYGAVLFLKSWVRKPPQKK